jgi:hypothetical protein
MKHVKLFEEFITHEIKNDFIDFLLQKIQPIINDVITQQRQKAEKEGVRFTGFEERLTELTLKYDLLKALGNYTKSSDRMIKGEVHNSNKGALTIDAIIERDGIEYPLHTNVIYAGGYNIQKLHFRYLTKTNLVKTNSNPEADKVKAELAKLSKVERLQKEIENYEKWIKDSIEKAEKNSKISDNEIYQLLLKGNPLTQEKPLQIYTWEDAIKNGSANMYDSKEEFEKSNKEKIDSKISLWKTQNIAGYLGNAKTLKTDKAKVEKKLDALINGLN